LNLAAVLTDVAEFLAALKAAERATTSEVKRASLERAAAFYVGELLPGCYEEWVIEEQHRLQTLYEQAQEALNRLGEQVDMRVAASPLDPPVPPTTAEYPTPNTHLPLQFTRFFGREQESARLMELLGIQESPSPPIASSPHPLIPLTGPGGIGKTRLAVEVA